MSEDPAKPPAKRKDPPCEQPQRDPYEQVSQDMQGKGRIFIFIPEHIGVSGVTVMTPNGYSYSNAINMPGKAKGKVSMNDMLQIKGKMAQYKGAAKGGGSIQQPSSSGQRLRLPGSKAAAKGDNTDAKGKGEKGGVPIHVPPPLMPTPKSKGAPTTMPTPSAAPATPCATLTAPGTPQNGKGQGKCTVPLLGSAGKGGAKGTESEPTTPAAAIQSPSSVANTPAGTGL